MPLHVLDKIFLEIFISIRGCVAGQSVKTTYSTYTVHIIHQHTHTQGGHTEEAICQYACVPHVMMGYEMKERDNKNKKKQTRVQNLAIWEERTMKPNMNRSSNDNQNVWPEVHRWQGGIVRMVDRRAGTYQFSRGGRMISYWKTKGKNSNEQDVACLLVGNLPWRER